MGSKCQMMDDFGKEVQVFLMLSAFLTLLIKWVRESPRRPFKIFVFDTSKQGFTSISWHFLNLATAWLYTSAGADDPCVSYFLLVLLDATVGLVLCYGALRVMEYVLIDRHVVGEFSPYEFLRSGKYGHPPSLRAWALQLVLWQIIVIFVKLTMGLLMLPVSDALQVAARFFLAPFLTHPHVELVVVMLLFPLFLNIIAFYITDNFLKSDDPEGPVDETELTLLNPWARGSSSASHDATSAIFSLADLELADELSSLDDEDMDAPIVMLNPFSTLDTRDTSGRAL